MKNNKIKLIAGFLFLTACGNDKTCTFTEPLVPLKPPIEVSDPNVTSETLDPVGVNAGPLDEIFEETIEDDPEPAASGAVSFIH